MVDPNFEIWSGSHGVLVIDNPVRRQILRALSEAPRSLTEMVQVTGKAKSTLSAIHMPELVDAGLVVEKRHPDDSRILVYELVGRQVATGSHGEDHVESALAREREIQRSSDFRSSWALIEPATAGARDNAADLLDHLAHQVARRWAATLRETRFPAFIHELAEHLGRAGIGRITAVSPMGHHFRLEGLPLAERPFFALVLRHLAAEKAGLSVDVAFEDAEDVVRIRFLEQRAPRT